jgi:hypothetical protein
MPIRSTLDRNMASESIEDITKFEACIECLEKDFASIFEGPFSLFETMFHAISSNHTILGTETECEITEVEPKSANASLRDKRKEALKEIVDSLSTDANDRSKIKVQTNEGESQNVFEEFVKYLGGTILQRDSVPHARVVSTDKIDKGKKQTTSYKCDQEDTHRGYGCIRFPETALPSCYVRIPMHKITNDPEASENLKLVALGLLFYVENVWDLQRPKLLVSITGGANDFEMDRDKENVLFQLMEVARKTQAWLVTGGTNAGIMKYVGMCTAPPEHLYA